MKNCALYARVSSSEQVKGYSLFAQLDAGRGYAISQGWSVVAEYVDPGISGTTDERPQFKRMIRDALLGQFEIIIVYAFDRFSRNLEDAVVYKSLLRRDRVQVISVTEYIDESSPLAFIQEGIIDLFAAYYSLNLSAKIRSGLVKAVESGRWPWPVPTGYIKKNNIVHVSEAGAGIEMAFKEFSTGQYTLDTWAEAAYQAGLRGPGGNKIRGSGWSRIFHNRFYIGRLTWNDLDVEGAHEALVDETTFNRVQEILKEHDRFSRHRDPSFFLLRGLCWSIDANDLMTGARAKGRNSYYRYYRSRVKNISGVLRHYIRAEVLESQVETVLSSVTITPQDIHTLNVDESMNLALRVAPNVAAIYCQLDTDQQRRALLQLVISRYGFRISGEQIVEVIPNPPFCFWLDINRVEIARVEPCYFFMIGQMVV